MMICFRLRMSQQLDARLFVVMCMDTSSQLIELLSSCRRMQVDGMFQYGSTCRVLSQDVDVGSEVSGKRDDRLLTTVCVWES